MFIHAFFALQCELYLVHRQTSDRFAVFVADYRCMYDRCNVETHQKLTLNSSTMIRTTFQVYVGLDQLIKC